MKILLTKEEIEQHAAFGIEFLEEISAPEGRRWKCVVFRNESNEIVAECECVETQSDAKKDV